jgi:Holliday junction resolvase RusA-like endonuclease
VETSRPVPEASLARTSQVLRAAAGRSDDDGTQGAEVRKSPTFLRGLICASCNQPAPRVAPVQKYCRPCSEKRDLERKQLWHKNGYSARYQAKRSEITQRGIDISTEGRSSLLNWKKEIDLLWCVRLAFPFDWAASKNHIFAKRRNGHVFLREEGRAYRDLITEKFRHAVKDVKVVQNKVWLDIFVQKPNQRGDAANFLDLICDAVKTGISVDDRWFSIDRLDWEIVKDNPRIFIGVGQESAKDMQACSSCGRLREYEHFHKNKSTKTGVTRNCKECAGARVKRAAV